VAVTGTNGKSTVTRLVAAMAAKGGRTVLAGGNLGTPVADLLARPADLAVLEVSSFQLFYSRTFVPEIAVLTNFAPDHLDWHPTLEHYRASKERMFARLAEEGIAVLPDVEDGGIRIPPAARVFRFGSDAACDARITGEALELNVLRTHARLAFPKAFDPEHQRRNLAAAALVGALLGGTPEALRAAASSYRHLPHRFVEVANVAGVRYVDDSKATNLHALIAAVRSVGTPVRLLVGGKRKNLDWAAALPHIADQIVGAYAFGECGADVAAAWRPTLPVEVDNHLAAALARASADARAGETVLLAPGTSSFDQYESYAERGQHFCELVGSLTGGTS
jgi:UDP-N-acetylmuramoylalanine--D-glutamate ligase